METKAKPEKRKKKLGHENRGYIVRGTAGSTLLHISDQSVFSLATSCHLKGPFPTQVMPSQHSSPFPSFPNSGI